MLMKKKSWGITRKKEKKAMRDNIDDEQKSIWK